MIGRGFRAGRAVVLWFDSARPVSLHVGDGGTPSDDAVAVPILDGSALFSGSFVLAVAAAWQITSESPDNLAATPDRGTRDR